MAAAERDRSDVYRSPSVGHQRLGVSAARTANPGTFGRGPRFGPPPQSASRARSPGPATGAAKGVAASSTPLRQGGYAGMAQTWLASSPGAAAQQRPKTPGALRSPGVPSPFTVPARRAVTPLSRTYTPPSAASASAGRTMPAAGSGPGSSRQPTPPTTFRGPSTATGYPSARTRTPNSTSRTSRPGTSRSPPPRNPGRAYVSPDLTPTARGRSIAYGGTPPFEGVRAGAIPGPAYTAGDTPRTGVRGLPARRPERPTDVDARFQDPGDDWLSTYERSSLTFIQELEGILGGLARLGGLTPAPMEGRAPPLQLPSPAGPSAGATQSPQLPLTHTHGQAGDAAPATSQGSVAAGARAGGSTGAGTSSPSAAHPGPISAFEALPLHAIASSQPVSQLRTHPQSTAAAPASAGWGTGGPEVFAPNSAGVAAPTAAPLAALPPGTLSDLWNVLQASNQNTARLMADLTAARREVELANERAEEADSLARVFQQQLIARQQHVASWHAAMMEVEERETVSKEQLLEAQERCDELAQRAQQAEHVAATAQLRLERLIAQRAAQLEVGEEQRRQRMPEMHLLEDDDPDLQGAQPQEAAQQLKLHLQNLQADLAAAQTRATRTELELAVTRNKALIAQQELTAEEDRARRATAAAAAAREELGRTRSALDMMGRDHDQLQHQLEAMRGKLSTRDEHWQRSDQSPPRTSAGQATSPWLSRASPVDTSPANVSSASGGSRTSHPSTVPAAGEHAAAASVDPTGGFAHGGATPQAGGVDAYGRGGRLTSAMYSTRPSDSSGESGSSGSSMAVVLRALGAESAMADSPQPQRSRAPITSSRQPWGSLLLLAPGEMPADANASGRYAQRLPMRRRSRSQDMGLQVSGAGGAGRSWLQGGQASALRGAEAGPSSGGGDGGSMSPRVGMMLRGGTHDGVLQPSSLTERRRDGREAPITEADGGGAGGSDEEKQSRNGSDSLQAQSSFASSAHRSAAGSALVEEMLPLSRTPSSGARRRPSLHRTSIGNALRGVQPPAAVPSQAPGGGAGGASSAGPSGAVPREPLPAAGPVERTDSGLQAGPARSRGQPEGIAGREPQHGAGSATVAAAGPSATAVTAVHGVQHQPPDQQQDQPRVSLADLRRQMAAGSLAGASETSSGGQRRTSLSFTERPHSAAETPPPPTLQQQMQQRRASLAAARDALSTASGHSEQGSARDGGMARLLPSQHLPPLEKSYSPPDRLRHGNSPAASPPSRSTHAPPQAAALNQANAVAPTRTGLSNASSRATNDALPAGLPHPPRVPPVTALPPPPPPLQPPRPGAVSAAEAMALPLGYQTSHHNDLYESIQSRWPGPAARQLQQINFLPEAPAAQGYATAVPPDGHTDGQDGQHRAAESPTRQVLFTSRSRMLSPEQLDSHFVSPSVTASMAVAASRDGALGAHGGGFPTSQQARETAGSRTLSATAAVHMYPQTVMELRPVRWSLAVAAGDGGPELHPSFASPLGTAAGAPRQRRPWWSRFLQRGQRRASLHGAGGEQGMDAAPRPTQQLVRAGNGPRQPHGQATAASSSAQPLEGGIVVVRNGGRAAGGRRWPWRRRCRDGNGAVQSALLHLGMWSGGVAVGVLIVLGVAGVVEGTLGLGGDASGGERSGCGGAHGCPAPEGRSRGGQDRGNGSANKVERTPNEREPTARR